MSLYRWAYRPRLSTTRGHRPYSTTMAAHRRMRIENNVVRGILNQCDQQLEYILINVKTVPLLLCIESRFIPPVARRR